MPKFNLNPCFKHWEKYDNIFIISDTHFGDVVTDTINGNDYREKNTGIKTPTIEEQVAKINKVCHKNDLLVILGDIGNIEPIKKIKAGYKVLVMGNHDQGKSNYEKNIKLRPATNEDMKDKSKLIYNFTPPAGIDTMKWLKFASMELNIPLSTIHEYFRNPNNYVELNPNNEAICSIHECIAVVEVGNKGLFDEVYPGICPIREDIVLSHEVYDSKYCLNIHGHDHNCQLMKDLIKGKEIKPENYFDEQLKYCKDNKHYYLNLCSEWVNYEPINLKKIMVSGILKDIPNIHREAIDKQIENPVQKKVLN